jgi:integrase
LTINNQSQRNGVNQMTVQALWDHYSREELPFKDFSTQDGYMSYAKNWILPRWGSVLLQKVKTVDVERWLREATVSNGTRAKIKCVMSALFSHAVRWEFTSNNPISSGIPVGAGGKRGPSVGVRVSAKRQKAPIVLSPEQVKLGLTQLEFRDQLLVLLDGALGTRRGELAALRWQDCDFENDTFQIEHSYYWRRGGILKSTKTEASAKPLPMHPALKQALLEWKTQSHRNQPTDFVFPSRLYGGRKALDLAAVLKRKIRPAFDKLGIAGVGWHTFRHTVGTVLAELGEHQLTIRDYLRHSNLSVTNKYLQAASKTKRNAQARLVEAILPVHLLPGGKTAETVAPLLHPDSKSANL